MSEPFPERSSSRQAELRAEPGDDSDPVGWIGQNLRANGGFIETGLQTSHEQRFQRGDVNRGFQFIK